MKAYLILEDGTVYEGRPAGTPGEVISEIVFNTSMTGYQEILTDPSYAGQAVALTYPLIGNYGVCAGDMESGRPFADGLIVREISGTPGSWRAENTLRNFLQKYGITGIAGVDTRHLTKQIRDKGTMNGCITPREYGEEEMPALLERIRAYKVEGVVRKTSSAEIREYPAMPQGTGSPASVRPGSGGAMTGVRQAGAEVSGSGKRVALLDTGTKRNIIRSLQSLGCSVTVYPWNTPAETILAGKPDGIMLSNGPGDPKEEPALIAEVRKLALSGIPLFAICLGHQLTALAMGGDTARLKFGHRGANQPVKDLRTGKVYITSQNHGYAVVNGSLPETVAVPAFVNLNDGTNEGLRYVKQNILTVQFHPEASPGPGDAGELFREFLRMMEEK